jgi:putative flippase GtrA
MLSNIINYAAAKAKVDPRFIKFLLVGCLNTLFGYGMFAFFIWLGCGDITAPLFSTILGILFNFKTIGVLVFGSKANKLIFRFFSVYALVYVLNVAGLKTFAYFGLTNRYISGFILLLPLALLAFCLHRKFVFTR